MTTTPLVALPPKVITVDSAMQNFAQGMQEAIAIWLALLTAITITFALLSATSRRDTPRGTGWWTRLKRAIRDTEAAQERQARQERSAVAAQELARFADELAVAAERAGVMAERRRAEWLAAQRTQEAAWRAFEQSELAVGRLQRAEAFPRPQDDADPVERRRHMVRLVNAAHVRGEISAAQLADALMHRNGWDPTHHPFDQQMMLRKVIRDRQFQAYQEASEIERAAAHAADMAAAAKRSLDDEAFRAALAVRRANQPQTQRQKSFVTAIASR